MNNAKIDAHFSIILLLMRVFAVMIYVGCIVWGILLQELTRKVDQ
jgi:hypothetical protein